MSPYLEWLCYLLLLVVCGAGLLVNILGMPGLWLIVIGALAYGWGTGFVHFGLWGMVTLVGLAVVAEIVEFIAGSAGAKAAGGSKRGMMGAVAGGLVGGIVGTGFLPVVGTIVGAIAGSFLGAAVVEMAIGKPADHSFRVGVGAAKGRFWGIVSKTGIGLVMTVVVMVIAVPMHRRKVIVLPPGTPIMVPASQPATMQ
ncbi:MAG TPA: DUF456 domain-containing protein [Tepidisphaeraceae bacterium]|jgi:hypothetical protein|nr:DUF456 domain-containing protein [Tepidisphaeraceae bacterium]